MLKTNLFIFSSTVRSKVNTADKEVPLNLSNRFTPSIETNAGSVRLKNEPVVGDDPSDVITRLKTELATSKSVQSELLQILRICSQI